MKRSFINYLSFLFLLIPGLIYSQGDSVKLVKFTPEFRFEDGIYLNFKQVKSNTPVPMSRLLTSTAYDDREFFNYLQESKTIAFYDAVGNRNTVNIDDLWGFSRNGVLYIRMDDNFHRITIVGQICHFVATITTYDTRHYDPYYNSPYNYYSYRYGNYPTTTSSSEMRQYLLNFENGEVGDYNIASLEVLLMRDPELHDEFMQLRRKKKKQRKFLYLRKFNDRNPLFVPVEQKFNP